MINISNGRVINFVMMETTKKGCEGMAIYLNILIHPFIHHIFDDVKQFHWSNIDDIFFLTFKKQVEIVVDLMLRRIIAPNASVQNHHQQNAGVHIGKAMGIVMTKTIIIITHLDVNMMVCIENCFLIFKLRKY